MPKKDTKNDKSLHSVNSEKTTIKKEPDLGDYIANETDKALEDSSPSFCKNSTVKRRAADMDVDDLSPSSDFSNVMSNMLKSFRTKIDKQLEAKKKCLQLYSQESVRATKKKISETTENQISQRQKMVEEFRKQLRSSIEQGEIQMEKAKKTEEKFQELIDLQQKQHLQVRVSHNCLKDMKILADQFFKGMDELESNHQQEFTVVYNNLKKEMSLLQKKFLMDNQQREMMNVRRNLMM